MASYVNGRGPAWEGYSQVIYNLSNHDLCTDVHARVALVRSLKKNWPKQKVARLRHTQHGVTRGLRNSEQKQRCYSAWSELSSFSST